ncbi:MAG TPA: MFS transporter [Polyangia bacterium]|jgi:predicted MFS family arabinose efflux permease|nr:MFS transporter [Polyangia bacterium]
MARASSERAIIFLIAAVQFVNILDFVMVLPLGPDFAVALGIPLSHLGYLGGSYTAAASVAGLIGSLFLDRFDRRLALTVAMIGLVLGTAAGAAATGLATLMAARVIAGLFGGPATSLAISIVADVVPPERRGKAMGTVMGAFSVASVLGVPAGLRLASLAGWRTPFIAVSAMGLLITVGVYLLLPPLRGHLAARQNEPGPTYAELLGRPTVLISYTMTAVVMMASFILIPNLAAYLQYNLGYPRDKLDLLYLVGGAVNLVTLQLVGRLVDRFGSFRVGTLGSIMQLGIVYFGFVRPLPSLPGMALFVSLMFSNSFRNVAYNTLTSKVPSPRERARFMSLQSAVQHFAAAVGAFLSSALLTELPDHRLAGIPRVGSVTISLTLLLPLFLWTVERHVKAPAQRPRELVQSA